MKPDAIATRSLGPVECVVTVIIPVYNVGEILCETLTSVERQTLDKRLFEVIVVDDGSTDARTLTILEGIRREGDLSGIRATVLRHDQNRGLSEARNTGARAARGLYLCCLDGDDLLEPDYLKKAALLLRASAANAGWVYPAVRRFGHVNLVGTARDFDAYSLFRDNYCVSASLCRAALWHSVGGQRLRRVHPDLGWFEDWDFWIRAMARGWYGVPLDEPLFLYRQHLRSLITRNRLEGLLSNYLVQWHNAFNLLRIWRADRRRRAELTAAQAGSPTPLGLGQVPDRLVGRAVSAAMKRRAVRFPWALAFLAAAAPRRFIDRALRAQALPTRAERACRFDWKVRWTPDRPPAGHSEPSRTILFAHNCRGMGGAQRVLLNWMHAARGIEGLRLIEVAEKTREPGDARLQYEFASVASEQHALDRVAADPLTALRYCWELLSLERPRVLFIMSNPFFYVLAPLVKHYFPRTAIVDLLHNENGTDPAWFGTAAEYSQHLDMRIVISDYWKRVLTERFGERSDKVHVATNAVDLSRFDPARYDREGLRRDAGIDGRKLLVAFVGRLDQQKNPMTFVELAELMRDDRDYEFMMVGDGDLSSRVHARARDLANLRLFGEVVDTAPFYALADVVVCPSAYEGYPLVSLEAAAMGVPVIAADVAGLRDQIHAGGFGLLYEPRSPTYDARTIRGLLYEHRLRWREHGLHGRDFACRYHDLNRQQAAYRAILAEALDHGWPSGRRQHERLDPFVTTGPQRLAVRSQPQAGAPVEDRAEMNDAGRIGYYDKVKRRGHVFIFGICGRSSSTALQRLLNSSNEVCLYGETWGAVDALLKAIDRIERINTDKRRRIASEHFALLTASFAADRHDRFYPNASRSFDDLTSVLREALANLLRPVNGAPRFGFKEIAVPGGFDGLTTLRKTFPSSHFLFLFREPCEQWRSVRDSRWFPYSDDLQKFLASYHRNSEACLRYAREFAAPYFVESPDLYDLVCVRALLRFLDITRIDESLIGLRVSGRTGSHREVKTDDPDDLEDIRVIENSIAYRNYGRMRELAAGFSATLAAQGSPDSLGSRRTAPVDCDGEVTGP
jgi:glycosyltransferase involved in cell wall biosynthesis